MHYNNTNTRYFNEFAHYSYETMMEHGEKSEFLYSLLA